MLRFYYTLTPFIPFHFLYYFCHAFNATYILAPTKYHFCSFIWPIFISICPTFIFWTFYKNRIVWWMPICPSSRFFNFSTFLHVNIFSTFTLSHIYPSLYPAINTSYILNTFQLNHTLTLSVSFHSFLHFWDHFLLICILPFSMSFSVHLLVIDSFHFCPEMSLFHFNVWRISLLSL